MLVGLGTAHQEAQAAAGHWLDVAQAQRDQLGAAQRRPEAEQQHGAIAGAERRARGRAGRQQQAQHVRHGGRCLLDRAGAAPAGDALDHHGEPGVAQVERDAGEQVGGADGGEVDAQRADRDLLVGAAGRVHGNQLGVAGERLAAEAAAPGRVAAPGRAVDPAGAGSAGAGGVEGGAGGERLQLGGASGAAGHLQVAQQVRVQGQRAGWIGRVQHGGHPGRNGLRMVRRPSITWPSCMSSEQTTSQPASSADARIRAS